MVTAHVAGLPIEETVALAVAGTGAGGLSFILLIKMSLCRAFRRQPDSRGRLLAERVRRRFPGADPVIDAKRFHFRSCVSNKREGNM
jgi:hypothetical protein